MKNSRYDKFINNGKIEFVPYIPIIKQDSDYYVAYNPNEKRLDALSYQYYQDPNYGWVILQANAEYGSMEFSIPQGTILRIPYPIENVLEEYNAAIKRHKELYG